MNLAAALSVEAAELLELFQWSSPEQSKSPDSELRSRAAEEIADVFLYVIRIADKLDIDLIEAARTKLALNATKYPVERSRGSSKKYTRI